MVATNPYSPFVDRLVSRALSMQNRTTLSSTYGCFDKNFWHFKTLIDFPCASYQQAVLGLSKLYAIPSEHNAYYRQPVIGEAVKAGLLYWSKIQNEDGSFNEYFQNDRSFCPTAFTTHAVAQAYCLTEDLFEKQETERIHMAISRSAHWLAKHDNPGVQNQMIASMLALYWAGRVTDDLALGQVFQKRRDEILRSQHEEGWFPEYGGADVGYSFKALDLFSHYLSEEVDDEVYKAAERLGNFVIHFVHPDGTCGGDYGSRCTQHCFPYGIEFMALKGAAFAKAFVGPVRKGISEGGGITPDIVDDKYAIYFYLASYVQSMLSFTSIVDREEASVGLKLGTKLFESAGILRVEWGETQAWIGVHRNGVCRVFQGKELVYSDTGYLLRLSDGTLAATQCEDRQSEIVHGPREEGYRVRTTGRVGFVDDSFPLTRWIVPFKLFCKTVLRFSRVAYWFHERLKRNRIGEQKHLPISIEREFRFLSDGIRIDDHLQVWKGTLRFSEVVPCRDATVLHSLSSRLYPTAYFLTAGLPVQKTQTDRDQRFEYVCSWDRASQAKRPVQMDRPG
jgi:hypothetical protein